MPILTRPHYSISYDCLGRDSNPPLILSHSLGANRQMWDPQVAAFAEHFRVLAYDHPGHGESSLRPDAGNIGDYGQDVLALMDACGIDRAMYCGLSLGGMVGMWLGIHAGERFSRMVLCSTAAHIEDPDLLQGRIRHIRKQGLPSITDSVLSVWLTEDFRRGHPQTVEWVTGMFRSMKAEGYVLTSEMVCALDVREGLPSVRVPTMVVYGTQDRATPPAANQWIAAQIPGAQTLALDSAHLANVECVDEFTDRVVGFLRQGR